MKAKRILKESKKRLSKKGYLISDDDRKKIESLIDELQSAISRKARAQTKKAAISLRRKVAETMPKRKYEIVLEYIISFGLAIIIALLIRHFIIEPFKIPTGSMIPTFVPGDYILVSKARYGPRIPFTNIKPFGSWEPKRWDIVVFTTKGIERASQYPKNFVKRVVGLPGEEIEIRDGEIYVNGELVEKPDYLKETIVPYGVIQCDSLNRYWMGEPPGQEGKVTQDNYQPISASAQVKDGILYVGNQKVIIADRLQSENLPLTIGDDGITVFINGIYYFNSSEEQRCVIETWDYRINLFDFHFWRIPGTGGKEDCGPWENGFKGVRFNVPEGHYLVLGDNSPRSYDSRGWGCVPYENIKGKVLFKWWPPRRWGIPR